MLKTHLLKTSSFFSAVTMSRTTLFEWLKTGILVQGKHYFKVGRILRFVWDETLLLNIGTNRISKKEKKQKKTIKPKEERRLHCPSSPAINLDY